MDAVEAEVNKRHAAFVLFWILNEKFLQSQVVEVHLVQNHQEAVDVVEVVVQLHLGKYFSSLYIYLAIK